MAQETHKEKKSLFCAMENLMSHFLLTLPAPLRQHSKRQDTSWSFKNKNLRAETAYKNNHFLISK